MIEIGPNLGKALVGIAFAIAFAFYYVALFRKL